MNTLVDARVAGNAEISPTKYGHLPSCCHSGSDYNGVNLRFIRAENIGRDVAESDDRFGTERIVMEELSNTSSQGDHGPCGQRPVIVEAGGLGVGG